MKKIFLCTALFAFVFSSCKKEDKCTLTTDSFEGNYKITSVKYKLNSSSSEVEAITEFFETCERDDIYRFNDGGVVIYDDAGVDCGGDDTGTWSLSGTTLSFDGIPVATVENFTCNGFNIIEEDYDVDGDRATLVFTRQ